MQLKPLAQITVPLGGQTIELHEVDFETGGMPLLRLRIREGKRFTVFDIDARTARTWADAMRSWALAQHEA